MTRFGINAHRADFGYNTATTIAAVKTLGVSLVRCPAPWNDTDGDYAFADAQAGAGFQLMMGVNGWEGPARINDQFDRMKRLEAAHPGCLAYNQQANEVNNNPQSWGGQSDPENGDMSQRRAAGACSVYHYLTSKTDPVLGKLDVVSYTDVNAPPVVGSADICDIHVYDQKTNGPLDWWLGQDGLGKARAANPGMRVGCSEIGSQFSDGAALQARYTVQAALTAIQSGLEFACFYNICDDSSGSYGLFNNDGTPRPSAQALAGLVALTEGCTIATNAPVVTIDPASKINPATFQTLMLTKPDGSIAQVMWTWDAASAPASLRWSLDRSVSITGIDNALFDKVWGSWSKAAGEPQDWSPSGGWDGSPFVLELRPQ